MPKSLTRSGLASRCCWSDRCRVDMVVACSRHPWRSSRPHCIGGRWVSWRQHVASSAVGCHLCLAVSVGSCCSCSCSGTCGRDRCFRHHRLPAFVVAGRWCGRAILVLPDRVERRLASHRHRRRSRVACRARVAPARWWSACRTASGRKLAHQDEIAAELVVVEHGDSSGHRRLVFVLDKGERLLARFVGYFYLCASDRSCLAEYVEQTVLLSHTHTHTHTYVAISIEQWPNEFELTKIELTWSRSRGMFLTNKSGCLLHTYTHTHNLH